MSNDTKHLILFSLHNIPRLKSKTRNAIDFSVYKIQTVSKGRASSDVHISSFEAWDRSKVTDFHMFQNTAKWVLFAFPFSVCNILSLLFWTPLIWIC